RRAREPYLSDCWHCVMTWGFWPKNTTRVRGALSGIFPKPFRMSPWSIRRTTCSITAPPIGAVATREKPENAVDDVRFCLNRPKARLAASHRSRRTPADRCDNRPAHPRSTHQSRELTSIGRVWRGLSALGLADRWATDRPKRGTTPRPFRAHGRGAR